MPNDATDDLALLHRYGDESDPRAFSLLVDRYASMVFASAKRVTGDSATAEDVSQDCFLKLARSSKTIRGSLGAWLHRASVNRSLEMRRSENARKTREIAAAVAKDDVRPGPAAALIERVDVAIASLPDELRVVVTEHFLCGQTQVQLAEMLGVNQSTIQRRIQAGLEQLRNRLKEDDAAPALAVLPLMFAEFSQSTASETLRQSLIKIGLSGVTGISPTAITAAPMIAVHKYFAIALLFGLAVAGISFVASRQFFSDAPTASGSAGNLLRVDQLPANVRTTLDASISAATFTEIERKTDGDRIVFDIDAMQSGQRYELRIAEDGTLIWKKP